MADGIDERIPATINFMPAGGDTTGAGNPPVCVIPKPDQAMTEDAESWLGYAIAALAAVAVAFFMAPALVPALVVAAVVVCLVAVAKTTTAMVDWATGKLGQNENAPIPAIIKKYQNVAWLLLLVLAVLAWQRFKRKR